ncbi:MAG: DNA cytosine methyltransferase [Candidatus Dormiibacterota bacterium]
MDAELSVLEICAGGGGQSFGLEQAGFRHAAAVEIEPTFRETLHLNRPQWAVLGNDVRHLSGRSFRGVDLLAGGVPCPPFSIAGKQLGSEDDRDLFPAALRLVAEVKPRAVMLENVRGLASTRFDSYRGEVIAELQRLGYETDWRVLNASDFGVPQLRPRFVMVGLLRRYSHRWHWPEPRLRPPTVGQALRDLMSGRRWTGARRWAIRANEIAPTIVGGSTKHGGPDLGPTRARAEWLKIGVDGLGLADDVPGQDAHPELIPRLTLRMVARLQGFPDDWQFAGRKTAAYRQIGNAFPPPVASAVAASIRVALGARPARVRQLERVLEPSLFA